MEQQHQTLRGLYIVTPDWDDTARLLAVTEQALLGGAAIVQYRHKTAQPVQRMEQAAALLSLCRQYQKPLIINDHLDLCQALDADGLHVGGTDIDVAAARAALGEHKIVGASCYGDVQRAKDAAAAGASYIAFGGFYPSRIKKYDFRTEYDIVSEAAGIGLPRVVIGGMTLENCKPLVQRGSEMVAVISSVYFEEDPQAAARAFAALF
ncbi:thiamine-phosphate synthase [Undibacterium squillarum]|uniref:Thiamine-phosphate synthase n=2 Tax=Undibacterium squillarum TaxID=1131567 RepID=A0ABQ2Y1E2_9BURK|nr:thiamine phosphate synthase [Undibacterium squillarum]GGX45396.1 thiamine-phosphate synthase [Undibacterium squillarum]